MKIHSRPWVRPSDEGHGLRLADHKGADQQRQVDAGVAEGDPLQALEPQGPRGGLW